MLMGGKTDIGIENLVVYWLDTSNNVCMSAWYEQYLTTTVMMERTLVAAS